MSTPVVGVTEDATIDEAAQLMTQRGFTTLPVLTTAGKLVGLVTEAELGRARFIPGDRDRSDFTNGVMLQVDRHSVRSIMRWPARAIPAGSELADLAEVMVESRQRCLPVLDGTEVVGMVSWRDLLAQLLRDDGVLTG